jgi:hypothetical protein
VKLMCTQSRELSHNAIINLQLAQVAPEGFIQALTPVAHSALVAHYSKHVPDFLSSMDDAYVVVLQDVKGTVGSKGLCLERRILRTFELRMLEGIKFKAMKVGLRHRMLPIDSIFTLKAKYSFVTFSSECATHAPAGPTCFVPSWCEYPGVDFLIWDPKAKGKPRLWLVQVTLGKVMDHSEAFFCGYEEYGIQWRALLGMEADEEFGRLWVCRDCPCADTVSSKLVGHHILLLKDLANLDGFSWVHLIEPKMWLSEDTMQGKIKR